MTKLLLLSMLAGGVGSPIGDITAPGGVLLGGTVAATLHLQDDIALEFGATKGAADIWAEWDTSGTDGFLLQSTDIDGSLTDGPIFKCFTGTDDCTFYGVLTVSNAGLTVGASTPFSDSSGTLTLQNIDALGATTESTIEGAIDTLANLTSVQAQTVTLAGTVSVEAGGLVANQDVTSDATPTFGGLTLAGSEIWNTTGLTYTAPRTTDATPLTLTMKAGDSWAQATGAKQTGANLNLSGGLGTNQVTIDDYTNCATDTVTITVDGTASVCTENDTPSAVQWDAATDDATSATNLAVCINAISGVSATATAAVVYVTPDVGTMRLDMAEGDATCTTLTEGTDGGIVMGGACWDTSSTTDIKLFGDDCSSTTNLYVNQVNFTGGAEFIRQSTTSMYMSARLGIDFVSTADSAIADAALLTIRTSTGDEMTDTDATQYGLKIQPKLGQSGTAAYKAFFLDVDDNGQGSGQDYLLDLQWDAAPMFRVQDDGEIEVSSYAVDYIIQSGSASLGPTAPGFVSNDSAGGLGFDVGGADQVYLNFEVPNCWDGTTAPILKTYWFVTHADAMQLNETVIWDFDWRSLNWGSEDVDNGTVEADSVTWTETQNPADDDETYEHTMTLAITGNQTIAAGDVITGLFTRDAADTYTSDAIVHHWEITIQQTKLKCDHQN